MIYLTFELLYMYFTFELFIVWLSYQLSDDLVLS